MTIISKIFLFSLYVLLYFNTQAQKNKTADGYIISTEKDTIRCKFNSFNSKKHPASISVRLNGNDTTFYPQQIREFISPSGEKFISRKICLFKYNLSVQDALPGETPEADTVPAAFLSVLYRGRLNLYLYKDALKQDYYFIEKDKGLQQIYSHVYTTTIGQTPTMLAPYLKEQSLTNNFQYLVGLKKMMQDCNKIFVEIDKTELKAKSLISLIKQYEKCPTIISN